MQIHATLMWESGQSLQAPEHTPCSAEEWLLLIRTPCMAGQAYKTFSPQIQAGPAHGISSLVWIARFGTGLTLLQTIFLLLQNASEPERLGL